MNGQAQRSVDVLFRCLRDDAPFLAQAVVVERHAFLLRQLGEGFDVLAGPSRQQERDAVTLGAGEVDGQFAVLDCLGFAAVLGSTATRDKSRMSSQPRRKSPAGVTSAQSG